MCLLIAGCGDDNGSTDTPMFDAEVTPELDAPPIDAEVCEVAPDSPEMVRAVDVQLGEVHSLTLDGNGTRCEQIFRGLVDPVGRPPALAELDAASAVNHSCEFDDVTDREIVRMRFPEYEGLPVYGMIQDLLAHVDASDDVVFLAGTYLPVGHTPASGCLDDAAVAASMPGDELGYTTFAACTPQGEGSYTIADDDTIEVDVEGVLLDGDGALRRVRAVDVYLHEDNVTDETINSDLFCCDGSNGVVHCVGQRVFVDARTGEPVGSTGHCITC